MANGQINPRFVAARFNVPRTLAAACYINALMFGLREKSRCRAINARPILIRMECSERSENNG